MSMAKEFRECAVKGNVIDMAAGVIIGGDFPRLALRKCMIKVIDHFD